VSLSSEDYRQMGGSPRQRSRFISSAKPSATAGE
jgi:hypothetical protein